MSNSSGSMAKRKGMKYDQCRGCYWWYNGECIRPKGEICIGRVITNYKRRLKEEKK